MKNLYKYRIFIGLSEIAGYFNALNNGFNSIGVHSVLYDLTGNKYGYSVKSRLVERIHQYAFNKYSHEKNIKHVKNILYKIILIIIMLLCRVFLFMWIFINYNIFIYSAAQSFIFNYDLPLLKLFKKKIIFVFLGTEARPPYISGKVIMNKLRNNKEISGYKSLYKCSLRKKRQIQMIEKYADIIISHPPIAHFQEKEFISHLLIGFPFEMCKIKEIQIKNREDKSIKILHAPSTPESKGTLEIREKIDKMKKKGYNIEYIEIVNKPNYVVLEMLAECDFVIDELYSDIPLGALGAEAAFCEKPVINGGYYAQSINRDYSSKDLPPTLYCLPEDIEQEMGKLIMDRNHRIKMGKKAREYVENYWRANKVAERYLKIIEGVFPQNWLFAPRNITYLHGYGLSEVNIKNIIKTYIEIFGVNALELSDKPELENKFLNFVC